MSNIFIWIYSGERGVKFIKLLRGAQAILFGTYVLRHFWNCYVRRIFGPKRDEVTGEWRNLHSEELHNLYSYPDIIRQVKSSQVKANEVGGACGTHGRGEKSVQGLGGKARRKETAGKTKAYWGRWDQNGSWGDWVGGCGLDSTGSGQGPVAGCCECGDEP
jgi:hypothetical protein